MEKEFYIEEYMSKHFEEKNNKKDYQDDFKRICQIVEEEFNREWNETDDEAKKRKLEREKRALMGYPEETRYYKERINGILQERNFLEKKAPPWYPNLTEGIFAELYGLSGLAPWAYDMLEKYKDSSSAKLIGDRLYCLINGKSVLQPQRIGKRRREQLKRTLLLATPYERLEYGFHEVYLQNGIRITIFSGRRTKPDQDIMIFRKYLIKDLSLENICDKGTFPKDAIPLFDSMINIGVNVIFCGEVRSGKTTFLQSWQKRENPNLEGLAIATDPETMWNKIMPDAPIMQIIADGNDLETITKSILRGDNDYILLEEMRDGAAFRLALDITSIGTRRCKATIHESSGMNVPYRMASKIREKYGGDLNELIGQVYKNFDYVIELCQSVEDRSKKIMKGIWEFSYDAKEDKVFCEKVCAYSFKDKKWNWSKNLGKSKLIKYPEEEKGVKEMIKQAESLYWKNPMLNEERISPAYYKGAKNGRNNN